VASKFGKKYPDSVALLLDISSSMSGSRINQLWELVQKFKKLRRFTFSYDCVEVDRYNTSRFCACGGTAMHKAFTVVKDKGVSHVVLITDGEPDSEKLALTASEGLTIDILYVGPEPAPPFLKKLAEHTKGNYGNVKLDSLEQITESVTKLLPAPQTSNFNL
jgi:hypothetical protein